MLELMKTLWHRQTLYVVNGFIVCDWHAINSLSVTAITRKALDENVAGAIRMIVANLCLCVRRSDW